MLPEKKIIPSVAVTSVLSFGFMLIAFATAKMLFYHLNQPIPPEYQYSQVMFPPGSLAKLFLLLGSSIAATCLSITLGSLSLKNSKLSILSTALSLFLLLFWIVSIVLTLKT